MPNNLKNRFQFLRQFFFDTDPKNFHEIDEKNTFLPGINIETFVIRLVIRFIVRFVVFNFLHNHGTPILTIRRFITRYYNFFFDWGKCSSGQKTYYNLSVNFVHLMLVLSPFNCLQYFDRKKSSSGQTIWLQTRIMLNSNVPIKLMKKFAF